MLNIINKGVTDVNGKPIPQEIEDYLMTPYGPPDRNARILPVPNDSVGLIIGKNGETIRRLHRETGCKIQVITNHIYFLTYNRKINNTIYLFL